MLLLAEDGLQIDREVPGTLESPEQAIRDGLWPEKRGRSTRGRLPLVTRLAGAQRPQSTQPRCPVDSRAGGFKPEQCHHPLLKKGEVTLHRHAALRLPRRCLLYSERQVTEALGQPVGVLLR